MTLIMSAATVAIGRRCDEEDHVEEIASSLVKKCRNAEKALGGVVTIMDKMEFDEKDPVKTACAIATLAYRELTAMMQDVKTISRTCIYRS